jgi:hypothetical protein
MININLVPEELIKKKKYQFVRKIMQNIPSEVFIGAIGGVLTFILIMNILLQLIIFVQLANCQRLQITRDLITPEKRQVDIIIGNLTALRQKIGTIENITSGKRVLWAQKLNIVSDIILPGVWLEKMTLEKGFLSLEGKSVSNKGAQLALISNFNIQLRNSPVFMMGVKSVDISLIDRTKTKMLDLGVFTIKATLDVESHE